MDYIGIDIGSTAAKVAVLGEHALQLVLPTGWSSKETAESIRQKLEAQGIGVGTGKARVVATGYGRGAVPYADKCVTEITCHAKGGYHLAQQSCTVIDIGGQDTKVIRVENGQVDEFLMNDKCAAGTGKFIEIMANRLGVDIGEMIALAAQGQVLPISALCTVFAESEVISYIGDGQKREDIAAGVLVSVVKKVSTLCAHQRLQDYVMLTGGMSHSEHILQLLGHEVGKTVHGHPDGRYAGAIGAALHAKSLQ